MKFESKKKNILKALILICLLFAQPLSSKAIDHGYYGDKPLFIEISTDWCFACKLLEPVIEQLKQEYAGKVTFVKLNPTSDESLQEAQQTALDLGISDFFNSNRNAFPRVAVYAPGGISPSSNLLGANKIDLYRSVLNGLIASSTDSFNGRPPVADENNKKPEESDQVELVAGRPEEVEMSDRPLEVTGSGRPEEMTFWTYGQPIPWYSYLNSRALPECTGSNQVLCYNASGTKGKGISAPSQTQGKESGTGFKPYNPNATRDEKGLHL